MAAGTRYAKAPIVEAVLQIIVAPAKDDPSAFESLITSDEGFDDQLAVSVESELQIGGEGVSGQTQGRAVGHVFRAEERGLVVQALVDRFVFSRVAPYSNWDEFSGDAWRFWERYASQSGADRVVGASLRFINKIVVPQRSIEIRDYLRTAVEVSPFLPQALMGYFLKVDVPLGQHQAVASITSTIVEPEAPDSTSLILDIDVRRGVDLSTSGEGYEAALRSTFDTLRDAKNFAFEACITDATRRLIE